MKIIKNKLTGETFPAENKAAAVISAQSDPLITILGMLSQAMDEPGELVGWPDSEDFSSGDKSAAARMIMQAIHDLRLKYMVVHMTSETLDPETRIRVVYRLFDEGE